MVLSGIGLRVGGSFTGFTIRLNVWLAADPFVSVTMSVIVAAPTWFVLGVIVTMRFRPAPRKMMLVEETRLLLEQKPESCRFPAPESSVTAIGIERATSSTVMRSGIALMEGGWFTGRISTSKLWLKTLFSGCPSSTVTVIVAVPRAL